MHSAKARTWYTSYWRAIDRQSTPLIHNGLLFWLTNMPYYLLSAHLMTSKPEAIVAAGPPLIRTATVLVIAMVSTAYHGMQVFGEAYNVWEPRLLFADLLAANGYGVVLIILVGWGESEVLAFLCCFCSQARVSNARRAHTASLWVTACGISSAAAMWAACFRPTLVLVKTIDRRVVLGLSSW